MNEREGMIDRTGELHRCEARGGRTDTRDLRAALDRREPLPHRSEDHREIVAGYDLDVASSYGGT